jgi:hypothetical protein
LLNVLFIGSVQGGSGFVQKQNRRVLQEGPCDGHPLFLPSRKLPPAASDVGLGSVTELHYELQQLGTQQRLDQLLFGCASLPNEQILPDCRGEEQRFLSDVPDLLSQPRQVELPQVDSVQGHPSLVGVVEAHHHLEDGRLAAAGLSHHSCVPAVDFQVQVLEHYLGLIFRIGKGNTLKSEDSFDFLQFYFIYSRFDG